MGVIRLMIYKKGDKVRIKDMEDMEHVDGLTGSTYDNQGGGYCSFTQAMEDALEEKDCDRIVTIESLLVSDNQYFVKELEFYWTDEMIECLAEDYAESEPVDDRWELLDL